MDDWSRYHSLILEWDFMENYRDPFLEEEADFKMFLLSLVPDEERWDIDEALEKGLAIWSRLCELLDYEETRWGGQTHGHHNSNRKQHVRKLRV